MPEVYDPTNGSMFRRRRRRKRKVANPNMVVVGRAESNASASPTTISNRSRRNPSIKDPLEFGSHSDFENNNGDVASITSPGIRRKHKMCLLSKNAVVRKIVPLTVKRKTDDRPCKALRATPLSASAAIIGTTTPLTAVFETSAATGRAKRDSTSTRSTENCSPYAIALDTRYLNTEAGKDDQKDFQQGVKHFLRTTFHRRGFSPSAFTWTECCNGNATVLSNDDPDSGVGSGATDSKPTNKHPTIARKDCGRRTTNRSGGESIHNSSNITIVSKSLKDDYLDEILSNVNGSPIRPPRSEENTKNRMVTRLPKGLMAESTWDVFGDLVEASIDRANHSGAPPAYRAPLRVVIFTSAASTLLDSNTASHIRSIDDFWDKTQCHFVNSKVRSIEIVVVMGKTVVVRTANDRCGVQCANGQCSDVIDSEESGTNQGSESDIIKHETTKTSNGEDNDGHSYDANTDSTHSSLNGSQADIIKTMERYIETKIKADFEMNRSRIQFDTKFIETQSRMNISFSVVDSAIDFHSLCQKWSRDSILAATAVNTGQPSPEISFQLPETTNFDECYLSFSTYYKNMPFRLDSSHAKQLYVDLELLGKAKLEVLQLVPFPSIDASLIYGVTIGLRAAYEDDEKSHHEKTSLVQSLFKTLATRDCALLLCSMEDPSNENTNFRDRIGTSDGDGGLFHSSEESQYFLLMPEFVVSQSGAASPTNGVLRRIASVDHILEETCAVDILNSPDLLYSKGGNTSRPRENPFSEFVEASLDCLNCSPLNPWIQGRLEKGISTSSTMDAQKQEISRKADDFSSCISKERTVRDENGQVELPTRTTGSEKEFSLHYYSIDSDKSLTDESGIGSIAREIIIFDPNETKGVKGKSIPSVENKINSRGILDAAKESVDDKQATGLFVTIASTPKLSRPLCKEPVSTSDEKNNRRGRNFTCSTSPGDSTDDSDFSSSSERWFGTFDYGTQ